MKSSAEPLVYQSGASHRFFLSNKITLIDCAASQSLHLALTVCVRLQLGSSRVPPPFFSATHTLSHSFDSLCNCVSLWAAVCVCVLLSLGCEGFLSAVWIAAQLHRFAAAFCCTSHRCSCSFACSFPFFIPPAIFPFVCLLFPPIRNRHNGALLLASLRLRTACSDILTTQLVVR